MSYADVQMLEMLQMTHHDGAPKRSECVWTVEGKIGLLPFPRCKDRYCEIDT